MIRELRYVNGRGESVSFGGESSPWGFGATDIFDMSREYVATGGRITSFRSGVREMALHVFMRSGKLADRDRFVDVTSYDVDAAQPGTLWAGGCFMRCWIPSASLTGWQYLDGFLAADVTVVSDMPAWVRQDRITLQVGSRQGGLNYPHDYPHNYSSGDGSSAVITNRFGVPAKLDIAFAGPCTSPFVVIAGNRYQVDVDASRGQLVIVRGYGRTRDVVVRQSDGRETSVFAKGVREEGAQLFAKVPVGRVGASWGGSSSVELTLTEERASVCWQM